MCVFAGTVLVCLLFEFFGRFDLAIPSLYSAVALGAVTAMRWQLRSHLSFWVTMGVLLAAHVLIILAVPWGTKWVPAVVIIPIVLADLYVMLEIVSAVERFAKRS